MGPEGSVYLADAACHRVYRLGTDGMLERIAGTGEAGRGGDGQIGPLAQLDTPAALAFDTNGNLYIGTRGAVRRMAPSGLVDRPSIGSDQAILLINE